MNKSSFAIANIFPGRLNALVKTIMKQTGTKDPNEAVRLVNSGEWALSKMNRKWSIGEDGIIGLGLVESNGLSWAGWINYFERKDLCKNLKRRGFCIKNSIEKILNSSDFISTTGVVTRIVALRGDLFPEGCSLESIFEEGCKMGFKRPSVEVACLVREKFSDKDLEDMDISCLVIAHKNSNNGGVLAAGSQGDGRWFSEYSGEPCGSSFHAYGFVFAIE